MFIAYVAQCQITGMFYVGRNKGINITRRRDHERSARLGSRTKFHRAIRAHGTGAFTWYIAEVVWYENEVNRLEREWIALLNSSTNG